MNKHKISTIDNDLIIDFHLLPLNTDDDHVDQESDSDSNSTDSIIEVDNIEQVNNDFVRLDLSDYDNSSEDEPGNSTTSNSDEEIICLDQIPSASKAKAMSTQKYGFFQDIIEDPP